LILQSFFLFFQVGHAVAYPPFNDFSIFCNFVPARALTRHEN